MSDDGPQVPTRHLGTADCTLDGVVLEQALAAVSQSVVVCDLDGHVIWCNEAAEVMYDWEPGEAIGRIFQTMRLSGVTHAQQEEALHAVNSGTWWTGRGAINRRDGSSFPAHLRAGPVVDRENRLQAVVAITVDLTGTYEIERARRDAETRFREGFEHAAFGLAITDLDHRFTSANPALCSLLGVPAGEIVGHRIDEFVLDGAIPPTGDGATRPYKREHRIRGADGTVLWAVVDHAVVCGENGKPSYCFTQIRDTTDRKLAEAALEHQARHDGLTGLPNRLELAHQLARAVRRAGDRHVAVAFVDIDRFKVVNDGLGHAAGDELLIEVAKRLVSASPSSETVARFGGDEFVIIYEQIEREEDAIGRAEDVRAVFDEPIVVRGRELYTTASIGVAVGDANSSADQLVRDADVAMYEAKDQGRAKVVPFNRELRDRVAARLDIEAALHDAIAHDELSLAYQPVVRLSDGTMVGAEALVRWTSPTLGVVTPAEFIPIAEETGLIAGIGEWVLHRALEDATSTLCHLPLAAAPWVAVNLSALQLRLPQTIDHVRSALDASGLDPSKLYLELTETAVTDDVSNAVAALGALKRLGVGLAVDDFGTGYSSLGHLKHLPIDMLKIDRTFVSGLPHDDHDRSITEAVANLAKVLGLTVVGEGVETVEQWMALHELGCGLGQGYLWGRPVDLQTLLEDVGAWSQATRSLSDEGRRVVHIIS